MIILKYNSKEKLRDVLAAHADVLQWKGHSAVIGHHQLIEGGMKRQTLVMVASHDLQVSSIKRNQHNSPSK
jgi:hypothetical protein